MSTLAWRDEFVVANGLRFHFVEWGQASSPPLVLLHGILNQAHIWDLFAPTVANRYRVIALDARGHGESEHAAEYGGQRNMDDAVAILDALEISACSLVGFSMGGGTALQLAAASPDRVTRLVIVDRGPDTNPAGSARLASTMGQALPVFPSRESVLDYIRLANPRHSDEVNQTALRFAFKAQSDGSYVLKYDPRLRLEFGTRQSQQVDLWACVRKVRCPTLLIRGGESDILMEATAKTMVELMSAAQLVEVPRAGHNVILDNPEAFNRVVGAFLP